MGTVQIDGSTPKLTIGNATAEDATILFDGNAQDFYIALDDSADDLLIGKGSTVGTTPAIAIDENLKVNIPVTTASTSASTGSLTTGGGAGIGADLYVGDDVYLITDSAVLGFGADKDTLLTHTDGTGLTLNSTNKLCFNDVSQFIQGSSATVISIGATDEIDLTATAVDLNGTLDVSGTSQFNGDMVLAGTTPTLTIGDAGAEDAAIVFDGNAQDFHIGLDDSSDSLSIGVGSALGTTSHLIMDSSGNILIGKTSNDWTADGIQFEQDTGGTGEEYYFILTRSDANTHIQTRKTSAEGSVIKFYYNATLCGNLTTDTNSTTYGTSSDYRLKENEVAISDGITRLKQLKPYRFNFKTAADKTMDGFFAHEVSGIIPEAIFGEKDGMTTDDDGNAVIEPQQIDQGKLVPLLTASLQEAITKIETLEAKVAVLEA